MRHFSSAARRTVPLAALALAGTLALPACDTFTNPNAPTETQVLTSQDGLLGLAVGTRREYSVGALSCLYNAHVADGIAGRALYVINTGNGDLAAIEAGRATLGASNAIVTNAWNSCSIVLRDAKLLVDNSGNTPDAATAASIKAYGLFFRAVALGTLARTWTHTPDQIVTGAQYLAGQRTTFQTREAAYRQAIQALKDAQAALGASGGTTSAAFNQRVGTGISLPNAIQALIARYSLAIGDYAAAITAAQAASLTVKSQWTFDATNPNPLYRSGFVSNNVVGGTTPTSGATGYSFFGLPASLAPEAGDARTAFYLGSTTLSRVTGFFKSDTDPIPVYLPGEMILIQAEAYARQATPDLAAATTQLNRVRTKTAAQDAYGVGAGLGAYAGANTQAALLDEIYKQRQIELYLQGLRLEDSRRFGRPGPSVTGLAAERVRSFFPFPQTERDGNNGGSGTNPTPPDPTGPEY